jgi:hypothetical protein
VLSQIENSSGGKKQGASAPAAAEGSDSATPTAAPEGDVKAGFREAMEVESAIPVREFEKQQQRDAEKKDEPQS